MEIFKTVKTEPGLAKDSENVYCSFYNTTPTGFITLQQFETYAVERLKVLKAVELSGVLQNGEDDEQKLKDQLASVGWEFLSNPLKMTKENDDKDSISHHILRLAYAKSESKRQWFVSQEAELLRLRMKWHQSSLNKILMQNKFDYEPVPEDEVANLTQEFNACRTGHPSTSVKYYKVDFEEVLQLVAKRKIYLSMGYAYLPETDLNSFILNKYKMYLKEQLAVICKHLPGLEEENRIMKRLQALSGGDLGSGYTTSKVSGEKITADMLDSLSQESYPLCMQMLHNHLKTKHHLKHDGRMQYGLFLKGMGVSLEESMKFWRLQFAKGGVDNDKFDKNYAYNIRHNYGKEGKRTDYTPYSCMKIISRVEPKADECHGCPFKHSDTNNLKQMLEKKRVGLDSVEEILALKKKGHYQVACMALFKATHPQGQGMVEGLQHPNQYFEDSRAILTGEAGAENNQGGKKITANKVPSANSSSVKTKPLNDKENLEEMEAEFDDEMV